MAASGFGLYFLERGMGSGDPTIYVHLVIFKILLVTLIKTQLLDVKPIKLLPCSLKLTYNI